MTWTCPHDKDGYCLRLKKDCVPTQKGCVLAGKMVRAIDMYPDVLIKEPDKQKPGKKDPHKDSTENNS
jgi:hypothetical protein